MTISPPKCRTCGAEEWRHVCIGIKKVANKAEVARKALAAPKRPKPKKGAKP